MLGTYKPKGSKLFLHGILPSIQKMIGENYEESKTLGHIQ